VRFEGSTNSDGNVYDLGTGVGYNFSHHFGVAWAFHLFRNRHAIIVPSRKSRLPSSGGGIPFVETRLSAGWRKSKAKSDS
jgi:hypothetical protein